MSERIGARRGAWRIREFGSRDDGSLTVLSLFIIICMIIAGGLAVDFMRQESARVRLSSTLDRAILAAADMDQQLDPTAVVEDYFAKAGLTGYDLDVQVSQGLTARRVSATTSKPINTFFLNFIGIDTLIAPAAGTAEESISNIEISLVLDVSTSMTERSATGRRKIEDLKTAAKLFVDTIYAQTTPGKTTISVVPYSTQVNVGAGLLKWYNASTEHSYSHCVDFAPGDFDSAALATTAALKRTGHFDPTAGNSTRNPSSWVCRSTGGSEIMPVEGDPEKLKAKIDSLVASGYTSIEIGVKWGSALLDPSARPAISGMVSDGSVPHASIGRPYDNVPGETLKVLVVMTDGINTEQWILDDRYRSGLSNVWLNPDNNRLSYKGLLGYWVVAADGQGTWQLAPDGGAAARQLTYPELWATTGVKYNAVRTADMLSSATGALHSVIYNLWTGGLSDPVTGLLQPGVFSSVKNGAKDARMKRICTAAKTSGVRIYAIGFEVTDASALVMQDCATTPSHFFRVSGQQIAEAFQDIANDIGKLRLTQ